MNKFTAITCFLIASIALTAVIDDTPADSSPTTQDDTPVQFDIFCDFRCPYCARLFNTLLPIVRLEKRQAAFRFRHFPFHTGSKELALFFEAAHIQDPSGDASLIESLYRFQANIHTSDLVSAEKALGTLHGLDWGRLKRDLTARDSQLKILEDERAAVAAGVHQTPSVFANGVMLQGESEEIAKSMLNSIRLNALSEASSANDSCQACSK